MALERLGVFKLYPHKTKFDNKDGLQYAPMHIFFVVKQKDLRHNSRLVVGGHVVDSTEHTTYSSTSNDKSMKIMILIAEKNGLVLVSAYILNALCTDPCAENI